MNRLLIAVTCLWAAACGGASSGPLAPTPSGSSESRLEIPALPPVSSTVVIFAGAGDIASCGAASTEATARLLDRIPGFVFSLGDNVYPSATTELFQKCYGPTWGRHRGRTYPTPGNHDWDEESATPYFAYFGAAAGPAGAGYYSLELGEWHIISLNSNIAAQPGSTQYEWLTRDLAGTTRVCSLAFWHHPLFNSGHYGNSLQMKEIWRVLDAAGVELVLNGHEHAYERFAPQDANGQPSVSGIREFIVGTGGVDLRPIGTVQPNSEVRNNEAWGVLKLSLRPTSADWEFLPIDGQSFRDSGTLACSR